MTEPKNIIFCADGSWSHPDKVQDGTYRFPNKEQGTISGTTNVFKLYDALLSTPGQIAFYDSGVGTKGGLVDHITGGLLGQGLFEKIKDGYADIARTYNEGDAIHLFGFSRGALTVNSLAEMISICGLPAPGKMSESALTDAFSAYRERDPILRQHLLAGLKANYGNDPHARPVKIAQIGVWDMVGTMGIPTKLFDKAGQKHYGFLSHNLALNVQAAWHALAIDEHRRPFAPFLWQPPFAADQKVDQVWFSGVHSDVGGGGRDSRLSDITLGWMMKKAASLDGPLALHFDKERFRTLTRLPSGNAFGEIRDSRNILGLGRPIPSDAVIASSVVERIRQDPRYHPANLTPTPGSRSIGLVQSIRQDPRYHLLDLATDADSRAIDTIIPATMTVEQVLEPSVVHRR